MLKESLPWKLKATWRSRQMQISRLEQQTDSLSENTNTQRYDLKPNIYDECDQQEILHDDIFKCIVSESHFSLYPDVFSDDNFLPLSINKIPKDIEDYPSKSPLGFQDKEIAIETPFVIFKHERLDLPFLNVRDKKRKI